MNIVDPNVESESMKTETVVRLKEHLIPSFEMLGLLIDYCPDDIWVEVNGGFPFWKQIYHTLYWNHRWLRENYNISHQPEGFGKNVTPHLDDNCEDILGKDELKKYYEKVKGVIEGYFAKLNDCILFEPVREGAEVTYFDVILSQISHIRYHVGHCNGILRSKNVKAVKWLAFGE